ncbi:DUF5686 and carboxypeptidase regulatory-like domain-containing protein [Flavobacterium sp. HSC-61S13]|uniref:DUF5686 and carboxypeptidase regulatory-like domain-containing protein n=1 Tax=Flavobacterium sp. HSC-61S13 TaxID=2910963 RepID=UPI00209CDF29|nr:DUF5686 and carboxypeptidase regulatory-like domain-containing protein [Flavobacterium sp. HSC-61S13]MCP1995628.1 hypothetical protein [Flavobacterium sp. HSC-61S13]
MRKTLPLFLLFFTIYANAQIKGKVTALDGTPLAEVSVYIEDSTIGTSTNEEGKYELNTLKKGNFTIIFQALGYQSKSAKIKITKEIQKLNIQLLTETTEIPDVLTRSKKPINPAVAIIKMASKNRELNGSIMKQHTLDFYSKGYIRLDTNKDTFLGQKLKDIDPQLFSDSLKRNLIYLSETVSKISVQKPSKMKEEITASKVSGNNKGFSFNSGIAVHFDFYKSEANSLIRLISPLAPIAPSYYNFVLEGSFKDANDHIIYKISATPKRSSEPVIDGHIYIVDKSWAIYAVDAKISGSSINYPMVDSFELQQNFIYNDSSNSWSKNNQSLFFKGKILVFDFSSKFNYVYSNYHAVDTFPKNTFNQELILFDKESNKRDNAYWESIRPIPLTMDEKYNYEYKESLLENKSTKVYLDSTDQLSNRFTLLKLIKGYEHKNSFKGTKWSYRGLLSTFAFNAVQGFNVTTGVAYITEASDTEKTEAGILLNYGIAENKPRFSAYVSHLFNKVNFNKFNLSGGMTVEQFGQDKAPIKNLINSIGSSWFGENFARFYQKDYIKFEYEQYAFTGIKINTSLEYANRIPLFNSMLRSPFIKDKYFESNNPMDGSDFIDPGFEQNNILKVKLGMDIVFDKKIVSYPNKRIYIPSSDYPVLSLNYEKGFSSSLSKYDFDFLSASTKYSRTISNFGRLNIGMDAGKFFDGNEVAFMDYKHFNANQSFVGSNTIYDNQFNLLPYYDNSTNTSYFQAHIEHDFKGYILNKIPLLNQLKYSIVIGSHQLYIPDKKPYHEISIGLNNFGFGKFRVFRIDYFRSYQGGFQDQGVVIGIKFLDLIQK